MIQEASSPAPTPTFPIPQYVDVPAGRLTDAVNQIILDFNAALTSNFGGAGAFGIVTRRQLFSALGAVNSLSTVYQAVNANPNSQQWSDFNASTVVTLNGTLANFVQSTLGYSAGQMVSLWTTAATYPP